MSLSQNLIALMNHLVPEQMARIVHLHKQGNEGDVSGGNLFFDRGLCSGKNQKRSVEFMGIALPNYTPLNLTYLPKIVLLKGKLYL